MSPEAAARAPGARRATSEPKRFDVLDAASLAERNRLRRSRQILALAGLILFGGLGAIAGTQSLVTSQQVTLDTARQQLASAITTEQQLQATRAQLEAPARILRLAERNLHMVQPAQVTYLVPVKAGPTLGTIDAPPHPRAGARQGHSATVRR